MNINYDKKADAMYLRLVEGKIEKSVEISDSTIVDVDAEGNVLGIEMLFVSSRKELAAALEKSASAGMPVVVH